MATKKTTGIFERPGRPRPYLVSWRDPATRRQRWRAFRTKQEAQAFQDQAGVDCRHGVDPSPKPIAFQPFAADWLTRRAPNLGPNTRVTYAWAITNYLVPVFGQMPLQALTAERIERWQAGLIAQGHPSRRSVEIVRNVLGAILKDARIKGRLFINPMEAVQRIDVPKRELSYLTAEQVKLLCEHVGRVYGVLFLLLAFCGLRIGEALGLKWGDLDFPRGRLLVRRQVIWRRAKDCPAGEPRWCIAEPKSEAGKRVVEIPAPLAPFLVAHQKTQAETPNPLGLVFPSEEGTPLDPRNVRRRHFQPALAALKVVGIRPHDFRRTFIAAHVEAGTHPKLVQTRVGHSDIRLTMDTYGKLAGEMALGAEQVERFAGLAALALPDPGKQLVNMTAQNGQKTPEPVRKENAVTP